MNEFLKVYGAQFVVQAVEGVSYFCVCSEWTSSLPALLAEEVSLAPLPFLVMDRLERTKCEKYELFPSSVRSSEALYCLAIIAGIIAGVWYALRLQLTMRSYRVRIDLE